MGPGRTYPTSWASTSGLPVLRPPSEVHRPFTVDDIWHLCLEDNERAWYRLLLRFPHLLGVRNADELTEEEVLWLSFQDIIERCDYRRCSCGHVHCSTFCAQCGTGGPPVDDDAIQCAKCGRQVSTPFCPECGSSVIPEDVQRVRAGEVDWDELDAEFDVPVSEEEEAFFRQLEELTMADDDDPRAAAEEPHDG